MPIAPVSHIMSVDVEDYFQVEAFAAKVPKSDWDRYPLRVNDNTRRILDLFDAAGIKATFFFVGWVAEKFPGLVKETAARGHELACHSYWHRLVYSLDPEEFRNDTRRARDVIEQAGGVRVLGYRAPSWSITRQSLWALDILAEEGFTYDSSIYPIHHDIYGVPGAKKFPYEHVCKGQRILQEFPPATVKVPGATLARGGRRIPPNLSYGFHSLGVPAVCTAVCQACCGLFSSLGDRSTATENGGGVKVSLTALYEPGQDGEPARSTYCHLSIPSLS